MTSETAGPASGSDADPDGAFASFVLEGYRFDLPGLPVGSAREVGAFRDAVLEMARAAWLDLNPGRERAPRGFEDDFDLRLVEISTGSTRLGMVLHRPEARGEDEWAPLRDAYEVGRDALTDAVATLAGTGRLPSRFPPRAVAPLKRVGATLAEDEALVFGPPGADGARAQVDKPLRTLLQEIDEATAPTHPVEARLLGVLTEFDGRAQSFQIRTGDGVVHTCSLEAGNSTVAHDVHEHLARDGVTAPDVLVVGGTVQPEALRVELFDVRQVQVVRTLAEKTVVERVRRIAGLDQGWDGPGSLAPADEALRRVEALAPTLAALGLPVTIVPDADGSVVLEWRRGDLEMTAEIRSDASMTLTADDTATDEVTERESPYDEARLATFLTTGSLGGDA